MLNLRSVGAGQVYFWCVLHIAAQLGGTIVTVLKCSLLLCCPYTFLIIKSTAALLYSSVCVRNECTFVGTCIQPYANIACTLHVLFSLLETSNSTCFHFIIVTSTEYYYIKLLTNVQLTSKCY